MNCPRDGSALVAEHHAGIEVDRCPQCNGRWLDHHELNELEATVAPDADDRRAMIEYAKRPSELTCPACAKPMRAFNYRAYNLELDTCEDEHGFWLDAGEERSLSDVMVERVRGLARAASAQEAWSRSRGRGSRRSVWNRIKGMFGGR
jgi:Zn-finger nucleic acid-binding protein